MKSRQPATLTCHRSGSLKSHIRDVCDELHHKALCFCHSECTQSRKQPCVSDGNNRKESHNTEHPVSLSDVTKLMLTANTAVRIGMLNGTDSNLYSPQKTHAG